MAYKRKSEIWTTAAALVLSACIDVHTVEPEPAYLDLQDELQARVEALNRTLVRCWAVPTCRGATLLTWTSWDSTAAPAFIIRPKP